MKSNYYTTIASTTTYMAEVVIYLPDMDELMVLNLGQDYFRAQTWMSDYFKFYNVMPIILGWL